MNYRVMNALRKIAADENSEVAGSPMITGTNIPGDYLSDRTAAWAEAPGAGAGPATLLYKYRLKTIEDLRRLQSRRIPRDVFKLTATFWIHIRVNPLKFLLHPGLLS